MKNSRIFWLMETQKHAYDDQINHVKLTSFATRTALSQGNRAMPQNFDRYGVCRQLFSFDTRAEIERELSGD